MKLSRNIISPLIIKTKNLFLKSSTIVRYIFKRSNISIAISTTKNYSNNTIPKLIYELKKQRVKADNIYVFEGGYHENKKLNRSYNHFLVDHNSFDLTSLISILEMKLNCKNWLLLHDTIELDKSFWKRYYSILAKKYDCMPLRDFPSMNIGVYSLNYLFQNKSYILSLKNTDYSFEALQLAKAKGVIDEDYLFKKTINKININNYLRNLEQVSTVEYFGKKRNKEFYPQLGIFKYKANFGQTQLYEIELV